MARSRSIQINLKPYSNKQRPDFKWAVYWPSDVPGAPRKVRRFKMKKEAKAFAEQKEIDVHNKGAEGGAVHSNAIEEAKWAAKQLEPYAYCRRPDWVGCCQQWITAKLPRLGGLVYRANL